MEKINLDKLNDLITTTGNLVSQDQTSYIEDDVMGINKDFEEIYTNIGGKDTSSILSSIKRFIKKEETFAMKDFEGRISSIFGRYDDIYTGIVNSISMFQTYNEGLAKEITNIEQYIERNEPTCSSEDDMVELNTIKVMLQNLVLTKSRIDMRIDSAVKLEKTMSTGRPIFQTLLSSAILEVSGQIAIDSSIKVLSSITGTINVLSNKLTQATTQTALIASKTRQQPLLYVESLRENIKLLQSTVSQIKEEERTPLLLTK